ncbi:glycosyltransferase family 4 protein [Staphylococcus equorum]|uniref:glycosyltransferase family 4 protein n=1 Tax=Staphylococcus equorum TaxID=246432 RepID=UPI0008FD4648|nr:hypothetical protein BFN02_05085 [Staphylococcus equorum]
MKKNIWILNHYATNSYFNQGGRHYWIAENLIKKGYNPTIFCANREHNGSRIIKTEKKHYRTKKVNEIPYVFIDTSEYKTNKIKRVKNILSFYINIQNMIDDYIKRNEKPDVIYASSVHPLTLVAGIRIAKKFDIPCISEVRDLWPESLVAYKVIKKKSIVTKVLYSGEKWIYKNSDEIVMTWEGGTDYIIEKKWDRYIDLNKVHHISNGILLKDFDSNRSSYTKNNINEGNFNFIYAGSIRKVNNVGLLLDAAKLIQGKNLNEIKILIYGDGTEREYLEKRCREENIKNVEFKGKVTKKEIPSILSKAYVNLLHNTSTSLDKYGQSQNKLFEYLAAGRPIIQTYNTGYNIIKKHECGSVVEKQNKESIAQCIIEAYNSPIRMRREGENARKAASSYDFEKLTDKMIGVIKKAMERREQS